MSQSYLAEHNVGFQPLQLSDCNEKIRFPSSLTIKVRRTVRSVSCNVGSDQLFDLLSRWHLQRDGSVEITSRGLSVYHTTSCCFLKTFCFTCPSGLSEHCTSRTPSRLTESCVPVSFNYQLQASQTHFNTMPLCYYPLSYLLYLSQQPID